MKENSKVSLYITNCLFSSCQSKDGVINIQQSRCFTITHCCATQCLSEHQSVFLYYDCVKYDFSLFLYNTIINSERKDSSNTGSIVFSKSGNHYYRCNNVTDVKSKGYQFEAPYYFSFSLNTIMNCHSYCLEITGQISQRAQKKYIDNVNIFHNGGETVLLISVQTTFELTFENSVVLSNSNALLENQNANVKPIFNNCIVNEKYDQNKAQYDECQFVDNSIDYLTIHPHFTYKDVCIGPHLEKKNTNAFG